MIIRQVKELSEKDLQKINKVFINNLKVTPISCKFHGSNLQVEYFDILNNKLATKFLHSDDIVHIKN